MHGHIVSILAAMQAAPIMEERLKAMHSLDYQKRWQAGELDTEAKRKNPYSRSFGVMQVSLVAGAGFEPAAFRL